MGCCAFTDTAKRYRDGCRNGKEIMAIDVDRHRGDVIDISLDEGIDTELGEAGDDDDDGGKCDYDLDDSSDGFDEDDWKKQRRGAETAETLHHENKMDGMKMRRLCRHKYGITRAGREFLRANGFFETRWDQWVRPKRRRAEWDVDYIMDRYPATDLVPVKLQDERLVLRFRFIYLMPNRGDPVVLSADQIHRSVLPECVKNFYTKERVSLFSMEGRYWDTVYMG